MAKFTLEDCRRCGGRAQAKEDTGWHYIECSECRLTGNAHTTKKKAQKEWNKGARL